LARLVSLPLLESDPELEDHAAERKGGGREKREKDREQAPYDRDP